MEKVIKINVTRVTTTVQHLRSIKKGIFMSLELFISILVISTAATSIAIEIIKSLLDHLGIAYKTIPTAMIVAFIIGVAEVLIYALNSKTGITTVTILYSICMGIANAIGSNVGYDKVKNLIYTLFNNTK